VHQQYKQIANAVSPQLTKALTREILCSLLEGVCNGDGDGNGTGKRGGGAVRPGAGALRGRGRDAQAAALPLCATQLDVGGVLVVGGSVSFEVLGGAEVFIP
jgi:hypothetical protein